MGKNHEYKKVSSKIFVKLLLILTIFLLPLPAYAEQPQNGLPQQELSRALKYEKLISKAKSRGGLRVIVGLDVPFKPEGSLKETSKVQEQRDSIIKKQGALLNSMAAHKINHVKKFKYIPYIAVEVDEAGLRGLIMNPNVTSIEEDVPVPPTLQYSVPQIGADNAWNAGYTGSGWTVAVLDTGVDGSHSFLSGKVVSEACYSTDSWLDNASTVCPNGQESQTGSGSGTNCDTSIYGCTHGTHVAGIAAGKGSTFSGVAKDANIIAIQVFSRMDDGLLITPCSDNDLPSPCALTYTSDQILGLEQVYTLSSSYTIAAVNMSLGGGRYYDYCDNDLNDGSPSRKDIINNLRSVGIATVISSGNDGYTDSISAPACISTAISVGAALDIYLNNGDDVASFSNEVNFLQLLAPGMNIRSSVPGGSYEFWSGTSMAAPHVAGAWAILKQKVPSASVDEILTALKNTGTPITSSKSGLTKPLIQVDAALDALGNVNLPKTGQIKCYDSAGTETFCAGTGQDGEIRAGVAWPNPRFIDNGDGTITDNLTGLMWLKDANCFGQLSWQNAVDVVGTFNTNPTGYNCQDYDESNPPYTDWTLPNINELKSLVNADVSNTATWLNTQGFYNVQLGYYWSSTTNADNTDNAWIVVVWSGGVLGFNKGDFYRVWPVRSGQIGIIQLPKTGQTTSYRTGDDGDLERGVAWPNPRFIDNGDCVTDNLTGLMWTKNANLDGYKTWQQALDYTNNLILCEYSDWRLPNRKEHRSLIDYSKYDPALPTGHPFINAQSDTYWSSTTVAYDTNLAWIVYMWHGYVSNDVKGYNGYHVWSVRGGQAESVEWNFDTDTTGIPPTGWTDTYNFDPGGIPYTREEASAVGVSISVDDATYYGASGKSVHFLDTSGNVSSQISSEFGSLSSVTLDFYMLSGVSGDASYEGAFVWLWGDAGPDYAVSFKGSSVGVFGPTGWIQPNLLQYTENTWYHVTRTLTLNGDGTSSGSFYVEEVGNPSNSNSYSIGSYAANSSINRIDIFTSNSQGADAYIDSITITLNYYCDDDSDGHKSSSISGTCIGATCIPAGCQTTPGDDCNDNDSSVYPGHTEMCDNKDNDCDGTIDENITRSTDCGVGACAGNTGIETCSAGQWGNNTCDPFAGATQEVCDSIDNDCNGAIDEGFDVDGDGYKTCTGDCDDNDPTINPGASDTNCNGVDENCSGVADDGYIPTPTSCGIGECASTGTLSCVGGQMVDSCAEGSPQTEGPAGDTTCSDGLDNDCDGLTDGPADPGCVALPGAFNKSTPANKATGQPNNPTLSWGTSSGATSYKYCYDTTNNNFCDTSWVSTGSNTSANLSGLSSSTTYYWQVRAYNAAGRTYANSGTWWRFTTQVALPGAFNKRTPANKATGQPNNPTLSWDTSSGATIYKYCYDTTNNNFCDTSWVSTGSNTSVNLSGLSSNTTYYWQVRAYNAAGRTYADSGTWWRFTTQVAGFETN